MKSNLFLGSISASLLALTQAALPIVDLGYNVHQATLNSSGSGYFNFSNIRYAEPPVGPLRFNPPVAPSGRNTTVVSGGNNVMCPQAHPAWSADALKFLTAYLTGQNISSYTNPTVTQTPAMMNLSSVMMPDSQTSEDCLFLDVIVPEKVFNAKRNKTTNGYHGVSCQPGQNCTVHAGAPVLVWIYGGGYTGGSKTSEGNPASLISRSVENNGEGVVYVAMNYRLGLFGWLAGNENVTANVGLLDQKLALDWIQDNISLFGGDPSRVTVMGESAGGGSIMHHITSYAGMGSVPFQRAISQSPAFEPVIPEQSEALFSQVLGNASELTNRTVSTADDLRALSFESLFTLNAMLVGLSNYGLFSFGPVIDPTPGSYVPDIPIRLIANGSYHNVSIMVGHNSNEGIYFTPPSIQTQEESIRTFSILFPGANESTISTIVDDLYPPVYNGTYGYKNVIDRTSLVISNFLVTCNSYYLTKTLPSSYGYIFQVPPGLHGQDIAYTFFNGDSSTLNDGVVVNTTVATAFQRYLTSFAMTGLPVAEGVPDFTMYGDNSTVSSISSRVFSIPEIGEHIVDPGAMEKQCRFWAEAPYYNMPMHDGWSTDSH
ncbi:uncharacterized protein L3040_001043 [Drepanopeziza brunnea f. sp. 'multigermtubi']|uniref:Carboxylic ester hydrolase n=1 Tax=Marssonina brunnea f. sp. multigermtubi (strain MB_m1) TaxID=1072389 RepID=K1WHT2_MARBU|nr:uncharacterized protein MBM_09465 [Drepanopeziza brunnea f. sp. 'multigermtubi' MB_m1]EKD12431.1 hypothetical protein MBM_09465 [Drepanopeziza brunnea f. sp. 'multigermtubi' MB_m1]KAJ5054779.1 hypothetical protein L3040_001043 [Drepanopeziza brunnea f. sp. 'multigermtubi']